MKTTINREELIRFGSLELLAKQVVEGFITGNHKSPFHGFSVEFAEHRLYNKGESTRHVDWKLYARTEKLFTKKYEEETNLRCQMVLDCSSSMAFRHGNEMSKLEHSILAIASLTELLKKQRDAVGLSLFSDHLELHTEAKSSVRHHRFLYSELEKKLQSKLNESMKSTAAIAALHDIAELCHKRSLIMIFSDMLDDPHRQDELFQAIQHLKHNKHEVILFHVINKKIELDFDLENRPYTFVDMETGEKLKLQPAEVKSHYTKEIERYFKEIRDKCANYRIDFVDVDTNEPLDTVLLRYLIKRDRMK
jgi:uncharacterized protein (DUF58 family)